MTLNLLLPKRIVHDRLGCVEGRMRGIAGEVMWLGAMLAALIWALVVLILGRRKKRKGAEDLAHAAADDAKVTLVVTLVHGTVGWFSSWLHERSRLRVHLASTLPGRIVFCRVQWSGLNSFKARRNGAVSLRRQICENASRWPVARQVVVAHSHGGSLSIEALNDVDCLRNVDGLVCMATPFLTLTRYRLPLSFGTRSLQMLFDFAAIYAVAILMYWLLPAWAFDVVAVYVTSIYDWFLPKDLDGATFEERAVMLLGRVVLPAAIALSLVWLARRLAGRCESVADAQTWRANVGGCPYLTLASPSGGCPLHLRT